MIHRRIQLILLALCSLYSPWISPARAELRVADTKYYRLRTDLNQTLANDLAWRMDALFEEYRTRLVTFAPPGSSRFDVYIFDRKNDYTKLTDGKFPNSGGVFVASRQLLASFFETQGRDQIRRTLQHEAFHQFAHAAISPNLPPWIDEGLAQVFEEGLWFGKRLSIGQVPPRRLRQLQHDMRNGRLIPFREFLAITDAKWHQGFSDSNAASAQYNQAWAMCHFLIFALDENGEPRFRQRFLSMLNAIHRGTSASVAFTSAFSHNIDGFEDRFVEYARNLQATREAKFVEYQSVLADMVVMAGKEDRKFPDAGSFRSFLENGGMRLRYSKGNMQWTTETDPNAYFRDSTGRLMTGQQFYFAPRSGAPYPDIVCKPADNLQLRTIFHPNGPGQVDHETLIEGR